MARRRFHVSSSRQRLITLRLSLQVSISGILLAGCLPPPRMLLSEGVRQGGDHGVWWAVDGDRILRGPIVGVGQRLPGDRVRQWLVGDRGVRCFVHHAGGLAGWGPPLATEPLGDGFEVTASLIRARFGSGQEPGWPGPPLPADEVGQVKGSAELRAMLQRHWADARTEPPAGLTPHEIEQAMEAAQITILDLLKAGM